jgi:hypothetical protein
MAPVPHAVQPASLFILPGPSPGSGTVNLSAVGNA